MPRTHVHRGHYSSTSLRSSPRSGLRKPLLSILCLSSAPYQHMILPHLLHYMSYLYLNRFHYELHNGNRIDHRIGWLYEDDYQMREHDWCLTQTIPHYIITRRRGVRLVHNLTRRQAGLNPFVICFLTMYFSKSTECPQFGGGTINLVAIMKYYTLPQASRFLLSKSFLCFMPEASSTIDYSSNHD